MYNATMLEKQPVTNQKNSLRTAPEERQINPEVLKRSDAITEAFLHLAPAELLDFRNRVQKCHGHVRIAIHPLYLQRWPKAIGGVAESSTSAQEVRTFLENGFTATATHAYARSESSPVIVFTEEDYILETEKYLQEILNTSPHSFASKGILVCPTSYGTGELSMSATNRAFDAGNSLLPELSYDKLRARQDEIHKISKALLDTPTDENIDEWVSLKGESKDIEKTLKSRRDQVFQAVCTSLGIKSVLMSGGYFYRPSTEEEKKLMKGCAGEIRQLFVDHGVPVDISKFSWLPRDVLKKEGFETKKTGKPKQAP